MSKLSVRRQEYRKQARARRLSEDREISAGKRAAGLTRHVERIRVAHVPPIAVEQPQRVAGIYHVERDGMRISLPFVSILTCRAIQEHEG